MSGLRTKLLLGLGGMLALLLAVAVLGNVVIDHYGSATQRVLREDLDGAVAAGEMRNAVGEWDAALAQASVADTRHEAAMASATTAGESARRQFASALASQEGGATLPRERELTAEITDLWRQYQAQAARFLAPGTPPDQRRALYESDIAPLAARIKLAVGELFSINVDSVRSAHRHANATANTARWVMHLLTLSGGVLALVFALLIRQWILRPVKALTDSVEQVRRGNLDLAVPVRSRDEIGKLAEAFNDMAAQLLVFRRIDHEKLIRTQRTTQLAIDSLPDAVVVINPQGNVELANETAKRLFRLGPGADLRSAPYKSLASLHHRFVQDAGQDGADAGSGSDGDNGNATGAGLARPPATSRPASPVPPFQVDGFGSSIKVSDDGLERYFLPKAVPILDEDRRQVGLTLVLADVTDFWRLDKMKSGLLSLVSHELKTPLTSMRMVLPLVLEEKLGPLTSRQRDLLSAAREDADRLHLIVENLLDMGRIESGKALLDVRPAEALDLVRRSLEPLRPVFEERGVDLRFDLPAPAPPASDAEPLLVKADATRIGHVFRNLLGNALRYTPAGGVVTVEVRPGKEEVEFRVSDTGSGIPREHLPRVFEKFFRAPGQSGESGAGLGLAIVKEVVEAHEGRVSAESREGRGATFRFTLPRAAGTAQRQPGRQPGRRHEEQWQEQCEERHDDVQPGEITTGALGAGGPQ